MLVRRIVKPNQTRQAFHDFFTFFSLGVTDRDMPTSSMSWNRPMISLGLTLIVALSPALAIADEFRADLIAMYESDGGRNIPNGRYDVRHTAGGVCQMTNETWREVAPTIDIDLHKFPNAGSASEHQQWQACWKLHALRGNQPWTCCNPKLRKALAQAGEPTGAAGAVTMRRPAVEQAKVIEPPHDWDVFPDGESPNPQPSQAPAADAAASQPGQDAADKSETDEK